MSQIGASNEYAINDIPDADKQSDPTLATEQIDSPEKGVFFAVEIDTFASSGGVSTSYFATTDFVTAPDDTPPDTLYEGRVGSGDGRSASFVVTRELSTSNGFFGGVSRPRFSDVPIANNDGGLDDFLENAVDGRRVVVKAGVVVDAGVSGKTVRLDESSSVIRATGGGWEGDGDRMSLLLKDPIEELQRPITRQRYAGTGGAEGTEALEDRTKPVALGQCFNVVPALIDSGLNTYQVSIGPISELLVVKDSGLRIGNIFEVEGDYADLVATPVEAGKIGVSLSTGYFKLGSPPAGQITCDVRGVTLDRTYAHDIFWGASTRWSGSYAWKATRTGPGYVNTVAGLANYILTEVAGWGHEEMNSGTLSSLDSLQDAIVGRYVGVGEETPAVQVLDEILAGAGCYLITDRLGRVSIGRFDAPGTTPDFELTSEQIVSLSRIALPYPSPPYRWSIGNKRNYRVMTDTDLADAAELEDDVRLLTTEQSTSSADDTTISTAHPKSSEQFLASAFQKAGEARTEARRLLTVYSKNRRAFEIKVAGIGRYNRLADTCKVTFNRHGLSGGKNFRITAVTEDYGRNLTTLRLFG